MKPTVSTHTRILTILGLLACTAGSHAGLVSQWSLEEGTGTTTTATPPGTASDTFGTGVAWSTDTPGPASTASLIFPGTTAGRVPTNVTGTAVGINGTGTKTITAWFKIGDTAGTTRMFFGWSPSNGITAGNDIRLGLDGSGFLRFEATSGGVIYGTTALDDNAWHMVALVIEASDTVGSVQFYIDGNLVNPTTASATAINTAGTGAALFNEMVLGKGNPEGTTQLWNGLLDDVRIYDTALDDAALDAIQAAMAVAPPSPLVWNNASTNGLWDTASVNWNNGTNLAFTDGDEVKFQDTSNNPESVSVTGTAAPSKTTFLNTLATVFELGGTGTLGGTGPVLVSGGGDTRFANSGGLSFTGALSVSNSSLVLLATSGNHGSTTIASGSVLELLNGASVAGPIANSGSIIDSSTTGTVTLQGVISGAGSLVKNDASTLVLSGNNTYTGNTAVNGGVLDLTGKLYNAAYNNSAVITVATGGTWKLADYSYAGVGQLADYAARRVLDGGTIEVTGATHDSGQDFTVTSAGGTFRYNPAVTTDTLTLRGNNNSNTTLDGTLTFDAIGNIAVDGTASSTSAILAGSGGLTKSGAGTLTLAAANTYTGDTTVSVGTLTLADNAQLRFVIGANGVNNQITGSGTVDLAGDFNLDLTGAVIATGNSWMLVNVATLTETYQSTFSLVGFTETANVHTFVDGSGNTWTFTEATGVLSVATPAGYSSWASANSTAGTIEQDHDNDGVSNGVEFFLGGTTNTTGFTALPGITTVAGVRSVTWTKAATYTGTYPANFTVETSTTLAAGSWTTETLGVNVVITGANVTYTFPAGPVKTFARLKVTGP